ncbi:transketolase [Ruminiclostridium herbifermentans]|uniref:Transketolase n=1 Tax=Ruminiclostridium herbifermentans TaxID=2488810 RepID=A0A4U7JEG8_9FIRM|nr:transketolase [Ruminiclostridium herbifermentans]QNU66830.1 transketolase [Ruminiclostridium herbifermentans]
MNRIDTLSINTIRILSAEAVQKANSGHPGLPLGAAPIAYTVWAKHMKHNPLNPNWSNRDRFILSAGHGSAMLYSILHLFGYDISIEDLKNFRQFNSKTPGHPEYMHTPGVEVTTGPLGQGVANGVGMAMAEAFMAAKFNRDGFNVVDNYTYVLCGDGCLMEGVASEAASLAGTLKLGKLILLYDSNKITIEGDTSISFTENVAKRFDSYGWQVINVEDGNDVPSISTAIDCAKANTAKPSIIIINTQIGYGSPNAGSSSVHGEPLGEESLAKTKEFLGISKDDCFKVPDEVLAYMQELVQAGIKAEENWTEMFKKYSEKYSGLAKEWDLWHNGSYDELLLNDEGYWKFDSKPIATRAVSGNLINYLAQRLPNFIGGSADLAPSNKTNMKDMGDFSAADYSGRNIHFGVREHAMASIANAMSAYGGLKLFCATFFVFTDYMKGAMRLSALMKLPVTYVMTHDSIGVGEDGPTHQPIEQLAAIRSIPNFVVFRPADSNETAAGWFTAVTSKSAPTCLVLTRQNLPSLNIDGKIALKGAYTLLDSKNPIPQAILISSGSEVHVTLEAGKTLQEEGIDVRVVSMPSWELFEQQSEEYKESVLPSAVTNRVAVEAASSFGWHKYVGLKGDVVCIDNFGASAPAEQLFKHFGFTADNIAAKVKAVIKK